MKEQEASRRMDFSTPEYQHNSEGTKESKEDNAKPAGKEDDKAGEENSTETQDESEDNPTAMDRLEGNL